MEQFSELKALESLGLIIDPRSGNVTKEDSMLAL